MVLEIKKRGMPAKRKKRDPIAGLETSSLAAAHRGPLQAAAAPAKKVQLQGVEGAGRQPVQPLAMHREL
jgi:hypothetical protein